MYKEDLALNNQQWLICQKKKQKKPSQAKTYKRCPRRVMVQTMDCRIVVSEFVLQLRYYVHFWANTLGKGMNTPYPPSYGLNSTATVFSRRMDLALNNLQRLICH